MPVLTLPFLYRAELVKPPKRRGDHVTVSDRAAFDIPEASATEAPVALRVVRDGEGDGLDDPTTFRFWDGRLYTRIDRHDGSGVRVDELAAELAEPRRRPALLARRAPGDWDWRRFPRQQGFAGDTWYDSCAVDATSVEARIAWGQRAGEGTRKVMSDDRPERSAEASALFPRTLLFIDDEVWSAQDVSEPRWVVTADREGAHVALHRSHQDRHDLHAFRADRRGDAMEWAATLSGGRGVLATSAHVEVLQRSALAYDDGIGLAGQLTRCLARIAPDLPDGGSLDMEALAVRTPRDAEWAAAVISAALTIADDMRAEGIPGIDLLTLPLQRWNGLERDRRADIAGSMPHGTHTLDDEALGSFTP